MSLNPDIKIAKGKGVDKPVLYVYMAGRIAGECIEKCLEWRHKLVDHYKNYKPIYGYVPPDNLNNKIIVGYESYPISFLDALNSKEADSIDKKGLTSAIPPNLIYDKDLLSVEKADVVVANVEDYFEVGIEDLMALPQVFEVGTDELLQDKIVNYKDAFFKLQEKIRNRRENFGTICEISWALYLKKPLILIVPESRREIYEKHPFSKRASVIVTSVDELIKRKWLNILYKSIASAEY